MDAVIMRLLCRYVTALFMLFFLSYLGKNQVTMPCVIGVTPPSENVTLEKGKTYPHQTMGTNDAGPSSIEFGWGSKTNTFDCPAKHTFTNIARALCANQHRGNRLITVKADDLSGYTSANTVTFKIHNAS